MAQWLEMVGMETLLTGEITGVLRPGEQPTSLTTTAGSADNALTSSDVQERPLRLRGDGLLGGRSG